MLTLLLGFAFIAVLSVTLNIIFMLAHIKQMRELQNAGLQRSQSTEV